MPSIPLEPHQLWLRSPLFQIEPGEDAQTNDGCYGRALARWVAEALKNDGLAVNEVFPEDWGWCVMVKKRPFRLWLGCGNATGHGVQLVDGMPTDAADLVWTCIVAAEVPLWRRFVFPPETRPDVVDLFERVKRLLTEAPGTALINKP